MYKNQVLILILLLFSGSISRAQKISGLITDDQNNPLAFSSVLIKGTPKGISANENGFFTLNIEPGTYTLICQRVGYQSVEKKIIIEKKDLEVNFQLPLQQYSLKNIIVSSGGEDPAYEIIRQAIKKRPEYEQEIKELQCEVYIKGLLRLRSYPKRFLGNKVDFEDGDTSKNKILFLSETIARYSLEQPDKEKTEVLSTKVSGNSDGFGLSAPHIISFYNNNINIGKNLNPRGFISPIADNALKYYDYKLEGSFFENGIMINRILVIPKRKYEPLFSGYINIMEGEWRVYSVQMKLLKDQQMQVLDTLRIEQTYVNVEGQWLVKQQMLYPSANLFGFDAYGSFVQVYRDFNLHPDFKKHFFGNTILKIADSTNKKTSAFWDSIRPIPLLSDEKADYKKKDSLEKVKRSRHYIDSLDKKRNKLTPAGILVTGVHFNKTRKKLSYNYPPIYDILSYNTVEGAAIYFSPYFEKLYKGRKSLLIRPGVRYGFNNHHFNADLSARYNYGPKYLNTVSISGGKKVFQYNNNQSISEIANTVNSLYFEENFMKIYEAYFARLAYSQEIGGGFRVSLSTEFQNRFPLENTTDYKWRTVEDKAFTPNYPIELAGQNMPRNKAFSAGIQLLWKPGSRYMQLPDRKINIGSKYPSISLELTQGFPDFLGSDVNYTKWMMNVYDEVDMKLAGKLDYRATIGGFLNNKKVFLPDYQHFNNSRDQARIEFLNNFQLMRTYQYSTTENFFSVGHVEYHLNGLLTNKIPYFRELNWFLVLGTNALYTNDNKQYYEYFISFENILKFLRIDFIRTYEPDAKNRTGIRLAFSGLLFN